jgi:hypothetical protein
MMAGLSCDWTTVSLATGVTLEGLLLAPVQLPNLNMDWTSNSVEKTMPAGSFPVKKQHNARIPTIVIATFPVCHFLPMFQAPPLYGSNIVM